MTTTQNMRLEPGENSHVEVLSRSQIHFDYGRAFRLAISVTGAASLLTTLPAQAILPKL